MTRFKLIIEYNGTNFHGWQKQENTKNTIQEYIQNAVYAFSGEKTIIQGAGRTDKGVHALGQVAHIDIKGKFNEYNIISAINYHLKTNQISILQCHKVKDNFSARFDAKKKTYLYRILLRSQNSPTRNGLVWHIRPPLNIKNMLDASKFLLGKIDFSSFRASYCQANNPIRNMNDIKISLKEDELHLLFYAPSFLYKQVRNIVGTLVYVGVGKISVSHFKDILDAKDRKLAGPTAPPHGLFLMKIEY